MVNKPKNQSGGKAKKSKIKMLNLNKETLKDLTDDEAKAVKGGTLLLSKNYQVSGVYSLVGSGPSVPPPVPSRGY